MLNYMKAELYKVARRRSVYGVLILLLAGVTILVLLWRYFNTVGTFETSLQAMLTASFSVGFFITIVTGEAVFSDQYKNNTMKNEVSIGIPRVRIYLGKLWVQCILSIVLCLITVVYGCVLSRILLPYDAVTGGQTVGILFFGILVALPLWLGTQAFVNFLYFFCKSSTVASIAAVFILLFVPSIFQLLAMLCSEAFWTVYYALLNTRLDLFTFTVDWDMLAGTCAVGVGWFVACTLAGVAAFRKREIS